MGGLVRCVRLQAVAKTALCCVLASVCWLAKTAGCIKATNEVSRARPDPFESICAPKLVRRAVASQSLMCT